MPRFYYIRAKIVNIAGKSQQSGEVFFKTEAHLSVNHRAPSRAYAGPAGVAGGWHAKSGNKKRVYPVTDTPFCYIEDLLFFYSFLSQLVDVESQLRLQVAGLVLVDYVLLCQLVQQACNARIHSHSRSLICRSTKFSDCISHRLSIISVMQSSFLFLSDSFQ